MVSESSAAEGFPRWIHIDNEAADVDLGSNPKAYKEADVREIVQNFRIW